MRYAHGQTDRHTHIHKRAHYNTYHCRPPPGEVTIHLMALGWRVPIEKNIHSVPIFVVVIHYQSKFPTFTAEHNILLIYQLGPTVFSTTSVNQSVNGLSNERKLPQGRRKQSNTRCSLIKQ